MKRILSAAVALSAIAMAPQAAHAVTVNLGPSCAGIPYFCIVNGATPSSPTIIAQFGNNITSSPFDDTFLFTIPQDGIGSGSLSTNFTGSGTQLTITDVLINGTSYASSLVTTSAGTSLIVGGIQILNGVQNSIQVKGTGTGFYNGSATFNAVPEPATWALLLAGFGAVGFSMRRRRNAQPQVRFAF